MGRRKNPFTRGNKQVLPDEHRAKRIVSATIASNGVARDLWQALVAECDPALRKALALALLRVAHIDSPALVGPRLLEQNIDVEIDHKVIAEALKWRLPS